MKTIKNVTLLSLAGVMTLGMGFSALADEPNTGDDGGANTPATQPQTQPEVVHAEPILGYQPDSKGITFQVNSGGCTQKQNFKIRLERRSAALAQVTLIRNIPDECRSFMPTGVRIYYTYAELGFAPNIPFVLANPNGVVKSWVWQQ